jgi:hypothetical protein
MGSRGYGVLDLCAAAAYAYVGFVVAPSRQGGFMLVLGLVVSLLAAAGVALVARGDRGRVPRALGITASAVLLTFAIACIALLCASATFLFGVYGALGRGIGLLSLVVAALVVELCGLLPLFQLHHHLRRRPGA